MKDFDVIVIGGGPGGYVAAIRCAQLGLETACIEDRIDESGKPALGGTCLNIGCIPSKALLDTSHHYFRAKHEFSDHGIKISNLDMNIDTMMQRKEGVVRTLTGGVEMLFAKHKITWLKGRGTLVGNNRVRFVEHNKNNESRELESKNIILATGSVPVELDMAPFDGKQIVDSTGALGFNQIPKRLGIIGGGVIGLELGSVWSRLGTNVSAFVRGKAFLRSVDQQIAGAMKNKLEQQGINILMNAKISSVKKTAKQVTVTYSDESGENTTHFDKVLVATGRKPNSDNLAADAVGLKLDERGFVEVNDDCRTNLPGVYAIGDLVRGPMLAHKASEEGIAVAERIAGEAPEMNYDVIPSVVYTWPELATVGKTSESLKAEGIDFKTGVFPFVGSGRAHASGDASDKSGGMVKILSDENTDRILGVHILGPNASELISEAVVAMEFSASSEDLARIIHAHPSLSEAVHEAALAVDGRAIHI